MQDEVIKIETRRLLKWGSFVLVLLGIFLLAEALLTFKAWRAPDTVANSISVSGTGEAYSVPDVATFSFAVTADVKVVSDAQNTVTTKMNTILASLKSFGIEDADIQTNDYSVNPKYVYNPTVCTPNGGCTPSNPVPDGYTVSHSVVVKVRDTSKAGEALAAVGGAGATNVSGLSFTTNDPHQSENEARDMAINDAKAKAENLADSLGVKLVRVIGYYDNNGPVPPMYDTASMSGSMKTAAAIAPTLPVGQNKTVSNVTVNYEIR
jgi:uncharacterized protein YggE